MNSPNERERDAAEPAAPEGAPPGFEQFFRTYPDSVFLFDREGRFVAVNPAAASYFSTVPEAIAGRHMRDLFPPEIAAPQLGAVMRVFETGEALTAAEAPSRTGQGARWFNTTLMPIKNARGEVVHVMGVARDITERIVLQEERAQRMSREADARKLETSGRLAGRVAHDFNNLLTVILGYARLLLTQVPEDLCGQVAQIQRAAERAAEMTANLLTFSRRQVLDRKAIDLNALLDDMIGVLATLLGDKVRIEFRPCASPACILADTGQIEQIVLNLAFNARDAMPEGGTITIRTERVSLDEKAARRLADLAPGPHVVLTFADTGRGMDAATQQHLFEPFFTTKAEGCGTGLGLATVYAAVKQHHGHVAVASTPGKGTTFTVYLPLAAAPAPAPEGPAARPASPSAGGQEKVLVVEDEETVRDLVAVVLRNYGYLPLTAATPEEALALWKEHDGTIDMCITDVLLPGMNGRALAERFQRDRPGFKVLFMSAFADVEVFHKGLMPAGSRFLQKPFSVDALLQELRATLDG